MIRVTTETFYFNALKEAEAAIDFEKRFGNKYNKDIEDPDLIVFSKIETKFYSGFKGGKLPAT